MLDGIKVLTFMLSLIWLPVYFFDLLFNNGLWWRAVLLHTHIDESFDYLVRLAF